MERRKAIAVAAAITMSLTSGVLAFGANFGAFGFGGGTGALAAKQNSVVAAASANSSATAKATYTEHERGEGAGSDHLASDATSTRGNENG